MTSKRCIECAIKNHGPDIATLKGPRKGTDEIPVRRRDYKFIASSSDEAGLESSSILAFLTSVDWGTAPASSAVLRFSPAPPLTSDFAGSNDVAGAAFAFLALDPGPQFAVGFCWYSTVFSRLSKNLASGWRVKSMVCLKSARCATFQRHATMLYEPDPVDQS